MAKYVTLVTQGGTPVRLANQTGTPWPTTGTGALVFANGATLTNTTFLDPIYAGNYTFTGNLTVEGNAVIDGTLTASGAASLQSTTITGNVDVSGNATVDGTLVVGGATTLAGTTVDSINKLVLTSPASTATLTLNNNSVLTTVGAYSETLTFTGTTNVTFPTSGTLTTTDATTTIIDTISDLRALTAPYDSVFVREYYTASERGGGGFWWDAASTETDNGGTIIKCTSITTGRYKRLYAAAYDTTEFGAVADAVFDTGTGAWTGTDNTSAFRATFLAAAADGKNWYCPSGNYIITGSVVLGGETPSNMEFFGDGDRTVIVPKINGQVGTFNPFVIGQTQINANGVTTGSPTYYLTEFVDSGSNLLPISTTSGLTVGVWAQMMDLTQPILNFSDGGVDGIGAANVFLGQAVKIIGLDPGTGGTFDIVYGTYDSATGETFIRVTTPTTFANGSTVTLSGLTGTGAFASLNGAWATFATTLSGPGTTDFYFTGTAALGALTITGGTVTWAGDATPRVVISPACEFNYAGSTTTPATTATCFRTYQPEVGNITFRDMRFSYDRTEPPNNSQGIVNAGRLHNTLFTRLSFEWPSRSITANGGINGSINQCNFTNGGAFTYCVVLDDGASGWRISDCYARGGRHFTQGGLTAQYFMASCHVRIENSQFSDFYLAPLACHGYARDWIFENNEVWGGTTDTGSSGVILRGLRITSRNNRITGCNTGVVFPPNQGSILDGGEIINCNIGVTISRTLEAQVRNYPFIQGSRDAHLYVYPYEYLRVTLPFPGINITAKVAPTRYVYFLTAGTYDNATGAVTITVPKPFIFNTGDTVLLGQLVGTGSISSLEGYATTTSGTAGDFTFGFTAASGLGAITFTSGSVTFLQRPTNGDVMWLAYTAGAVPPMADTTRIDIISDARAPVFTTWEDDGVTPLGFPFPGEFSTGVAAKIASWTVVPYLAASYLMDTAAATVRATLPASADVEGMRVSFKKTNVGGNVADILPNGTDTIEGAAAAYALADLEGIALVCNGGGWWIVPA